ncbi:uncharacterized [Tachysurus ichikawai]
MTENVLQLVMKGRDLVIKRLVLDSAERRRPLSPKMELGLLRRVTVADTNSSAPGLCIYSREGTFQSTRCAASQRSHLSRVYEHGRLPAVMKNMGHRL